MSKEIKFNKTMSTFSLMMTGITTIVGSGWLLATQKIANIAGPAGIISWLIGAIIVIIVALFCIEIGTKYPSAGGIGYYSTITHGKFSGFMTQWINWLSIMAVPPVEAQAIVNYLSDISDYCHSWYDPVSHTLTMTGIIYAIILMLFFMLINYWGLKLFVRFNNVITVLKLLVPTLTIVCLLYMGFHPSNFISHGFAPFGYASIATAIISSGVIMSFNGFQSPLTFSEEIPNPSKQLPIAIVGGILITFVLYVLLQFVFIGSINPDAIMNGWNNVHLRAPYVDLLIVANLQVMAWSVMASAVIAPASCGAGYIASSSRVLYSIANNGLFPKFVKTLDVKHHSPRVAMLLNTAIGCIFLFLFRGWSQLVAVISVLHVFSYLSVPIVVIAYRKFGARHDTNKKSFSLPFGRSLGFIITWVFSILLFYAGWPHVGKLFLLCVLGVLVFIFYYCKNFSHESLADTLLNGSWLLIYLILICLIAYLGNNISVKDQVLNQFISVMLLGIISLSSLWFGVFLSGRYNRNNIVKVVA